MAELDFTRVSDATIGTPNSGVTAQYVNATTKALTTKDDAAFRRNYANNFSTAAQSPAAATRTYLTGSNISIGDGKLQIGSRFRWTFNMTKTGAGTALSTIDICVGTAGTTADTARVSFTKPAGTAVIDEGKVVIDCICRGPLSASGIFAGHFTMTHNLSATGHMVIPCADVDVVSAGFDVTVASLIVGICLTSGASDAITLQSMFAEAWNI